MDIAKQCKRAHNSDVLMIEPAVIAAFWGFLQAASRRNGGQRTNGTIRMAKSYTEELAEWVSQRTAHRPRQDKNVVAFLAVKGDVKAALDAGYSMKTIWAHLHAMGRIAYRYETFTLHVKRHIRTERSAGNPVAQQAQSSPQTPAAATKPDPAQCEPRKTPPPSVGGFTFNATPKKEDLF